jgi:glycosyltransferase involved in cell wall biosynthesis
MKKNYVLITPAHNEEENIERVIKSVVSQTIAPQKWIIVNDGSTDGTDEIIKQYEARHNFITSLRLERKDIETYYGHRTRIVLTGYEKIKNPEFDFLGVLDADISLEPTYYECILAEFDRNPRLGIASGIYVDKVKGQIRKVVKDPDEISTPGALQVFRRECYEAIGGYIPLKYGGDDSLAEIMARMDGWETKHFPKYQAVQHRITGTSEGTHLLVAKYREGLAEYILGTHPLFALAKSFRRVFLEKPFLLASTARLSGFLSGYYLVGKNREVPDTVVNFVRREQMQRLRTWGFAKLKNST